MFIKITLKASGLTRIQAASITRDAFRRDDLNFRFITLREPPKLLLIAWLDQCRQNAQSSVEALQRCARVQVVLRSERGRLELHELIVDLDQGIVIESNHLEGKHSYIDADYMKAVEQVCLADKNVQKEIELLELPDGATVVVEPWAYATDGMNDMSRRTSMVS